MKQFDYRVDDLEMPPGYDAAMEQYVNSVRDVVDRAIIVGQANGCGVRVMTRFDPLTDTMRAVAIPDLGLALGVVDYAPEMLNGR